MSRGSSRGFTLIEVLVAATLLAVGIAGVLSGLSGVARTQARAQESEHIQLLALRKLDELMATEQVQTNSLSGDFTDWGEPATYQWTATVSTTGVQSLNTLTLTVSKQGADNTAPSTTLDTVYYQPATTTATGATQ